MTDRPITAIQEDYLESILFLAEEEGLVRSRDIASRLKAHKSTVSNTLRSLADRGLVDMERYGYVTLTERGRAIAKQVAYRHRQLKSFLQNMLLLDETAAEVNACRMEHGIDTEVVERLALFADYIGQCPEGAPHCFSKFCKAIGYDLTVIKKDS